tara:strand:- start:35 stop:535 length:501 start_codon:yes stop_codon:yes gene_type:complete
MTKLLLNKGSLGKLILILYLAICYSQTDIALKKVSSSGQVGYSSDKNIASFVNISFNYAFLKDSELFLNIGMSIIPGTSIGIKYYINNLFFTYSLSSFLLPGESVVVDGPYHSIASGVKFKSEFFKNLFFPKVGKDSNSWWNIGLIYSYIDESPFILPFINYEAKF